MVLQNTAHRRQRLTDEMWEERGLETVNINDLRNRQKKRTKEKVIQYVREQESKRLRKDVERLEELEC